MPEFSECLSIILHLPDLLNLSSHLSSLAVLLRNFYDALTSPATNGIDIMIMNARLPWSLSGSVYAVFSKTSRLAGCLLLATALQAWGQGEEIGVTEDFALAPNREEALEQLIPGSEEYYYYHCLHYQNSGQLDKVQPLLEAWRKSPAGKEHLDEMRNRQALLNFNTAPEASLKYLRNLFNPELNYQRIVPGQTPNLTSSVEANEVDRAAFEKMALEQRGNHDLSAVNPSGLPYFINKELDANQVRDLLNRIERPDHEGISALVERDLKEKDSRGFGSVKIHQKLLLSQLNALRRAMPELDGNAAFVNLYLEKLSPPEGADLELDNGAREEHINRLLEFTSSLPPSFNSLKASVLYQRLAFDESVGRYDKGLFMEYLKLPRNIFYVSQDYAKDQRTKGVPAANLSENFEGKTHLPPIGSDEDLVRRYLMQFFVDASAWAEFQPYVEESYLKEVFAETKLLNGIGEPDQWFPLISPEKLQALRDRVEIQFVPSNPKQIDRDDIPKLNALIKNVSTLIVRVYQINTDNYYRQNKEELGTGVNLDGLVANQSQTYTYTEPPLRRMRREFQFPELKGPGAWILEFIGNGISSRVVVRKGRLQYLLNNTAAGQEFTVLNEKNEPVPNATLWLNGQYFKADPDPAAQGVIRVPYTNTPENGSQDIVLSEGGFSSLASYNPEAETYGLNARFLVEPQSLRAGDKVKVAVRAGLSINGQPMSVTLLEKPRLEITAVSHEVRTTQVQENFELKDDAESIYEFTVPPATSELTFRLSGEVKKLTGGDPAKVEASSSTQYQQIEDSNRIAMPLLTRTPEGYVLELRGKNGEPLARQPMVLEFHNRDFEAQINLVRQTDERGQVKLGALNGISGFKARPSSEALAPNEFLLPTLPQWHDLPTAMHMVAGDSTLIPFRVNGEIPLEEQVSLLELRDDTFTRDWVKAVTPQNGFLKLAELPPGDFSLRIKPLGTEIRISVAEGQRKLGWVVGPGRQLELGEEAPMQILSVVARDKQLEVTLANNGPNARVHIIATRYLPGLADAQGSTFPLRQLKHWPAEISYESGRLLGEEYRYVIERKYISKFPGNLLQRPSLLLNPWELHKTETTVDEAKAGEDFAGKPANKALQEFGGNWREGVAPGGISSASTSLLATYEFLPYAPVTIYNIKPDSKGFVTLPLEQLGENHLVRVIATDSLASASWELVLPPPAEFQSRDLRLKNAFDPRTHRAQTSQVSALQAGRKILFQDADSTDYQIYDTQARVFELYETLGQGMRVSEFRFLLNWPKLTDAEKQETYSKYACHELNFYLYKKDKTFFESVVKPYLRNKKDKTFLDHWLLEDDLAAYRDLSRFQRLNVFEQILLSQRFPEMQTETFRRLAALYDVNPTPPERWNTLFETALRGRSLSLGAEAGSGTRTENLFSSNRDIQLGSASHSLGDYDAATREMKLAEADKSVASATQMITLNVEAPAPSPPAQAAAEATKGDFYSSYAPEGGDLPKRGRLFSKESAKKMMEEREEALSFYRAPEKTRELAENNYFETPIDQQNASLIPLNAFWRDFAAYNGQGPFISENFAESSENLHSMLLALAVLDIPFEAAPRQEDTRETGLEITANGPMIVFRREFAPAEAGPDVNKTVFVSQHFFAENDKFVNSGRNQEYKYIEAEFVKGRVYGAHIIVTNSSATTRKLNVLAQIPRGSLPVQGGRITRAIPITLSPYSTQPLEYYFYFPEAGEFTHYPVQVSQDGELLAFAPEVKIKVLPEAGGVDQASWEWISQNATDDDLFKFLDESNLERLPLSQMAFRMADKAFFTRAVEYLRRRQHYDNVLWAYAFQHADAPALKEYLEHQTNFVANCGKLLDSPLLKIEPVEWRFYQYLEYEPLINARIHRLGNDHKILNDRFMEQYRDFMRVLGYKPALDSTDRLALSGYLFLQDRTEEALATFAQVKPEDLESHLQYDYVAAYAALYREDLPTARALADRYLNYPVPRWRKRFEDVKAQLDEIQGLASAGTAPDALKPDNPGPETVLEAKLDGTNVSVNYAGISTCTINYYLMDVEMLFSRNPFLSQDSARNDPDSNAAFSIIQPNLSQSVALPAGQNALTQAIPEEFRSRNLIIEVQEGGIKRTLAYYANRLIVELSENYGRLKVRDATTRSPLPRIYVKAYARLNSGEIVFYKDGYTDLRGVFDYSSLSTDMLDNVDRFALLILSEDAGAAVKEAAPPQR